MGCGGAGGGVGGEDSKKSARACLARETVPATVESQGAVTLGISSLTLSPPAWPDRGWPSPPCSPSPVWLRSGPARLALVPSVCHGGQIAVSQAVYDAVAAYVSGAVWADLGQQPLRGVAEPLRLFQALPAQRCVDAHVRGNWRPPETDLSTLTRLRFSQPGGGTVPLPPPPGLAQFSLPLTCTHSTTTLCKLSLVQIVLP